MDSEVTNPISPPLFALLERLTILNGQVSLLDNQLNNFRKFVMHNFEEHGFDTKRIFAGYKLTVTDLTVPIDHKYQEWFVAGKIALTGDKYLESADELISHSSAWAVAQSFEAFETFLRDINASYYLNTKPSKPIGHLKQIPIEADSLSAWKSYFRSNSWNTRSLLEQVRASAPSLGNYEKLNIRNIDLGQWHLLFIAARHAITHSNSLIYREQLTKLSISKDSVEKLLPLAFPGLWQDDTYKLTISKEDAKEIIEITAAYACLIFKCASEVSGFDPEVITRIK